VEAAGIEPAGLSPQTAKIQRVTGNSDPLVSTFVAPAGRRVTLNADDWQKLVSIMSAWPLLDPNVREAIAELVRKSLLDEGC
jgi:hypothetical protein